MCKYPTFYKLSTPFLVAPPFENNFYYHNLPHPQFCAVYYGVFIEMLGPRITSIFNMKN